MPGRVFKRGEIYWVAFYCKGVEFRTSAKTDKKREAENLLHGISDRWHAASSRASPNLRQRHDLLWKMY